MSHNETKEGLSIELGGVRCIISVLWATDQSSYAIIIENNFQILYSLCTQTINHIIFIINDHLVLVAKSNEAYTHQKIVNPNYSKKLLPKLG